MSKAWRKLALIIGAVLVLGLAGAGIAYASIPDPSGVIDGCYKTSGPAQGALIVIDSSASCPSGYAALNWHVGESQTVYAPYMDRLFFTVPNDGQTHVFSVVCNAVTGHDVLMGLAAIVTNEGGGYAPYAPMSNLSLSSYGYANSGYVYVLGNSSSGPVQDLEVDLSCAKVST